MILLLQSRQTEAKRDKMKDDQIGRTVLVHMFVYLNFNLALFLTNFKRSAILIQTLYKNYNQMLVIFFLLEMVIDRQWICVVRIH